MKTIYMVHGYNHNPEAEKHSPFRWPDGHFTLWENGPLKGCPTKAFPWYSAVQFRDAPRAWLAGYPDTYKWAYGLLAVRAAETLARVAIPGSYALCHSLGARVVLQAMKLKPGLFSKVILLNGAETAEEAGRAISRNPDAEFLNVAVRTDNVLSLAGSWFAPRPGRQAVIGNGLGAVPINVRQVILDERSAQKHYRDSRGWDLRGDNPDSAGDHCFSFNWPGNWPLLKAFLEGDL